MALKGKMSKTPKPLTILVHHILLGWDEITALSAQGHTVFTLGDSADLILAPNAWRMTEDLRPYLELAVKAARTAKYGKDKEGAE